MAGVAGRGRRRIRDRKELSVIVRRGEAQVFTVGEPAANPEPVAADFTAIFTRHFDYVWHTLRRLGVREPDLQDVTHDVFVAVHRHLREYDVHKPVRPWLFAFAIRTATDYRRLARHRLDLVDDMEKVSGLVDGGSLPEDRASAREQLDQVTRALDALPWERRVLFVLHEIDGVSVPEAAALLGISVNTASSRLRLARDDFATAIRRAALCEASRPPAGDRSKGRR
jgi:RNA polymerase sigma-70 factor (ECF subfamily)